MTDDNDVYTPAQYREHQDGYGVREPLEERHTGIVRDPLVSRFLAIQATHYDPTEHPEGMPGAAHRLQESKEIMRIAATETGREALAAGDMPTLKHLTGDQKQRADVSGLKAIQEIDEIILDPAPVLVIIGDMGAGKTDAACLIGQRATHLLGIEKVASNIPSLEEVDEWTDRDGHGQDGFVPNLPALEEWLQQDGDPLENEQTRKLFIGDEFSSVGSGTGKDGYHMRTKMGPLVFKIRKWGGMLIYVAHDASSIHPLLWRVGYIIKKESKKEAKIAERIKNGRIRDVRAEISGFPKTDWRYNTKDPAVWAWDSSTEPGKEEIDADEMAKNVHIWTVDALKSDGLTDREAAKFVPYGKSWVNSRWNEIKKGQHADALDAVEAVTA